MRRQLEQRMLLVAHALPRRAVTRQATHQAAVYPPRVMLQVVAAALVAVAVLHTQAVVAVAVDRTTKAAEFEL